MRVQLHDLSPGQQYAIQFRSNSAFGSSEWSQVQRFTTTNDTVAPAAVQNLQFYNNDDSYIALWDKVTTNADSTPLLDFRYYHVKITNSGTSVDFYTTSEHFQFTKQQNEVAFGSFQTAVTIAVSAVDMTYNESAPVTAFLDPAQPPVPSTPGVGNYIGLLLVTWNKLDNAGNPMADNVVYCEVHISTVSNFTPSASTFAGTLDFSNPTYIASGLSYGTTYYVKLVAYNSIQKKSNPSAQGSGSPQRVTGLDIQNGQISAEQINWVATGIPGGNAYYSTTAPTGGTYSTNDIWYDIGNAYTPHHWTGAAWGGPATDVGFIVGTKILAGTLTANAIGANQIITASANIANAVIDDAHISNVSAAKITAGTISSNIVISGKFTTSATGTGARREMNGNGFQAWDASNNQTINLDGIANLLTGTVQTALTGRRIVIGASGSQGVIDFYSTSGAHTFLQSWTEPDGTEAIQLGVAGNDGSIFSPNSLWNRVNYNNNNNGWATYYSNVHQIVMGGINNASGTNSANPGQFAIFETSDYGQHATARLNLDSNGFELWDSGGTVRVNLSNSGDSVIYDGVQNIRFWAGTGSSPKTYIYNGSPAQVGAVVIQPGSWNSSIVASPGFQLVTSQISGTGSAYGAGIGFSVNNDGTNGFINFMDMGFTTFYALKAAAFTQSSDARTKTDIGPSSFDTTAILTQTPIRQFKHNRNAIGRKSKQIEVGKGNTKTLAIVDDGVDPSFVAPPEPDLIGFIAQEVHKQIQTTSADGGLGVDLGQAVAVLWDVLQKVLPRLDALEKKG